uniref:Uncharacterized protein n=1 Tax=viral metagenome TaxID=1070528 RepID=A0A6C0JC78_9ZZZZ
MNDRTKKWIKDDTTNIDIMKNKGFTNNQINLDSILRTRLWRGLRFKDKQTGEIYNLDYIFHDYTFRNNDSNCCKINILLNWTNDGIIFINPTNGYTWIADIFTDYRIDRVLNPYKKYFELFPFCEKHSNHIHVNESGPFCLCGDCSPRQSKHKDTNTHKKTGGLV